MELRQRRQRLCCNRSAKSVNEAWTKAFLQEGLCSSPSPTEKYATDNSLKRDFPDFCLLQDIACVCVKVACAPAQLTYYKKKGQTGFG